VEELPADDDGLIRIWRSQAVFRAQRGEAEAKIVRFLVAKGVSRSAATDAVRAILQDHAALHPQVHEAARVFGIVLLILGLVAPVAVFLVGLEGKTRIAVLAASVAGAVAGVILLRPAAKKRGE
jgi:hypothetical protein